VFFKPEGGQNSHRFINLENFDVCSIFDGSAVSKWGLFKNCEKLHPEFCHKCPYPKGEVAIKYMVYRNDKFNCPQAAHLNRAVFDVAQRWPDGEYRYYLKIFNSKDPEGFWINYYYRIKNGDKKNF
jgi:hypothetical protein